MNITTTTVISRASTDRRGIDNMKKGFLVSTNGEGNLDYIAVFPSLKQAKEYAQKLSYKYGLSRIESFKFDEKSVKLILTVEPSVIFHEIE